eukprot:TRINITY_DN715_c1_g1_i1.p1 TRINITY_DN715_c1_g1~~TRINITY_DN715_c1_g1_i1.p1  ORF type:complete len:388 (+),score=-67.79 TRINITY_DN715_c1_g1_i1:311-1474(+)
MAFTKVAQIPDDEISARNAPRFWHIFASVTFILSTYILFMAIVDPYALVTNRLAGKILPNNHLYQYNYLKHKDTVQAGIVGSSAVNYFSLEAIFPNEKKTFSMGIESSNIHEHVAYGRLLADHGVKEVIFFVTFYALNPSRPNREYFTPWVVRSNNIFVDFFDQYFNKRAFFAALNYLKKERNGTLPTVTFHPNGERNPTYYSEDADYSFDETIASYLAWESIDPEYHNSYSFKNPESLSKGIKAIKSFKDEMEARDISVRIVYAPTHRLVLALIYRNGLWETFQKSRRELAHLGNFSDLNLDVKFNNDDDNWWDTHHTRQGDAIGDMLVDKQFNLTEDMVDQTEEKIRPDSDLLARLDKIFETYPDWDKTNQKLEERINKNSSSFY